MNDGYYWLISERSSYRGVAQYILGKWFLINEEGGFTMEEINVRGWTIGGYIGTHRYE